MRGTFLTFVAANYPAGAGDTTGLVVVTGVCVTGVCGAGVCGAGVCGAGVCGGATVVGGGGTVVVVGAGAAGTPVDCCDVELVPTLFVAVTTMLYVVPFVNPVNVNGDDEPLTVTALPPP